MTVALRKFLRRTARRAKAMVDRIPSLDFALVPPVVVLNAFLLASGAGDYLNESLFLDPVLNLRAAFGLEPRLPATVRVIAMEDISIERLGRQPSFGEWLAIGDLLTAAGFEKILLLGLHDLKSAMADLPVTPSKARFVLGAVATSDPGLRRTVAFDAVAAKLLTPVDASPSLPPAAKMFAPLDEARSRSERLGHLNLPGRRTVAVGFATPGPAALPNLALLALDDLRWENGRFRSRSGVVPQSEDGTIYLDFLDLASTQAQTVPAITFFTNQGVVKSSISDKVQERLAGGKIAVLVPEAFTGSRFVDGPRGKIPSYATVLATLTSAITGRYLYRPMPYGWFAWSAFGLAWLVLRRAPSRLLPQIALIGNAALVSGAVIVLSRLGWVVACAHAVLTFTTLCVARAAFDAARTVAEKLKMRGELELGRLVQEQLLPQRRGGAFGVWEYQIFSKPFGPMSGDWFQVFETPHDAPKPFAVLAIGDVVGKGASAALITAVIAGVWHDWHERWLSDGVDLKKFLAATDAAVARVFRGQQNSTFSLALLTHDGIDVAAGAGPPWLHFSAASSLAQRIVMPPSNPLGMGSRGLRTGSKRLEVSDHDVLIALTDGVIDGSEGRRTFLDSLAAHGNELVGPGALELVERLATKAGAASVLPDDATILVIRRRGQAAERGATNAHEVAG